LHLDLRAGGIDVAEIMGRESSTVAAPLFSSIGSSFGGDALEQIAGSSQAL